jgi:Ca2+/Na+ antiporter
MLQSLLSAIVETLLSTVGAAIIKFLGLENAVEFATAIFGLSCIVIGFTMYAVGHSPAP